MKCKVCGKEFTANNERHYVARENVKTGALVEIAKEEEKIFDAFDCPHCGCQLIAQERKRQYIIPNEVAANEEEEHKKPPCYGNFDEEGGIDCDGCEYGEDCVREEINKVFNNKPTCIGHCDEECECDELCDFYEECKELQMKNCKETVKQKTVKIPNKMAVATAKYLKG